MRVPVVAPVPTGVFGENDLGLVTSMAQLVPLEDTVGGEVEYATAGPPLFTVAPSGPYQFQVTLVHTGSGYKEGFQVQIPKVFSSHAAPLLVMFHGYGNTAKEILTKTDFFREAFTRGWFAVAPLGAAKKSYSSLPSQHNVELVLDWMIQAFGGAIDSTRIYGVGFSMGGGNLLNYSARHLDPARPMFAALVNHSGTVDLKDVYAKENDGSNCTTPTKPHCVLEFWYGGSPQEQPFAYERSSVIDRHPSLFVVPGTDLARNLTHVPVRNVYAKQDPLVYLVNETITLHKHLMNLGGVSEELAVQSSVHEWGTLDEDETLDWLAPHRLELPRSESTLADRSGVWFHFRLTQDGAGQFTPFTWVSEVRSNTFRLSETKNLAGLVVAPGDLGLRTDLPLTLELSTADGLPDVVELLGFEARPRQVLRDGVQTSAWVWNAPDSRLTLAEVDGTLPHLWHVLP